MDCGVDPHTAIFSKPSSNFKLTKLEWAEWNVMTYFTSKIRSVRSTYILGKIPELGA